MGKREAALSSPWNSSATRAMSLENVEIVRRGLKAWNADDLTAGSARGRAPARRREAAARRSS